MGWKRAGMKYTCGAAAANARGAGGVELWRNVDAVDGVLGSSVRFRVTRAEHLCGKRARG